MLTCYCARAGAEGEAQFDELDDRIRKSEWIVVGAGYNRSEEWGRLKTLLGGLYTGVANAHCDNAQEMYVNHPELKNYEVKGSQAEAARIAVKKLLEIREGRRFTRAFIDRSVVNTTLKDQYDPVRTQEGTCKHILLKDDHVDANSFTIQFLSQILDVGAIVCCHDKLGEATEEELQEMLNQHIVRTEEERELASLRFQQLCHNPIRAYFGVDEDAKREKVETEITEYDASNASSHIKLINSFNYNENSPMRWIMGSPSGSGSPSMGPTSKVGVMIAGNAMRIGGGCVRKTQQRGTSWDGWQYCELSTKHHSHLDADTQEESVISFLRSLVRTDKTAEFDQRLVDQAVVYYPGDPTGAGTLYDPKSYQVVVVDSENYQHYIDVRNSRSPLPYKREANVTINAADRVDQKLPTLYISFVAAPNCNENRNGNRNKKPNNKHWTPDTMHRALALEAVKDLKVFATFIRAALVSSLKRMAEAKVTHAIMAGVGCGIYAGNWETYILGNICKICKECVAQARAECESEGTEWTIMHVAVPKYS